MSALFHGHDQIWVRHSLDGTIYQALSNPADNSYPFFNADAYLTGDKLPGSGYTRVTVGPTNVKVEYVCMYLMVDETIGQVEFRYTIP